MVHKDTRLHCKCRINITWHVLNIWTKFRQSLLLAPVMSKDRWIVEYYWISCCKIFRILNFPFWNIIDVASQPLNAWPSRIVFLLCCEFLNFWRRKQYSLYFSHSWFDKKKTIFFSFGVKEIIKTIRSISSPITYMPCPCLTFLLWFSRIRHHPTPASREEYFGIKRFRQHWNQTD